MKKTVATYSRGLEQLEGRTLLSSTAGSYDPSHAWQDSTDATHRDQFNANPSQNGDRHSDNRSNNSKDLSNANHQDTWQASHDQTDSPDQKTNSSNDHPDGSQVLHDNSNSPDQTVRSDDDHRDPVITADPPPPVVVFNDAPISSPATTGDDLAPVLNLVFIADPVVISSPIVIASPVVTSNSDSTYAPVIETNVSTVVSVQIPADHQSAGPIDIDPPPKHDRPPQFDNDSPDHSSPSTILVHSSGPLVYSNFPNSLPPGAPPPGGTDTCPKAVSRETSASASKSTSNSGQAGDAIVLNASGSSTAQTPGGNAANESAPNPGSDGAMRNLSLAAGFGHDFYGNDSNGIILATFDMNASTFASADAADMSGSSPGHGALSAAMAEVKLIGADISDDVAAAGQMLKAGMGKGTMTASADFMKTLILCDATALANVANATASRIDAEIKMLRREFCIVAGVGILIGIYMLKGRRDRTGSGPATSKNGKGDALALGDGYSQLFAG